MKRNFTLLLFMVVCLMFVACEKNNENNESCNNKENTPAVIKDGAVTKEAVINVFKSEEKYNSLFVTDCVCC